MRDRIVDEKARGEQDDRGEQQALGHCRTDEPQQRLRYSDRRAEQFVDGAGETRHVDPETGIAGRFAQQGEHQQARNDEGAVIHPAQIRHAPSDRRAKDDEI